MSLSVEITRQCPLRRLRTLFARIWLDSKVLFLNKFFWIDLFRNDKIYNRICRSVSGGEIAVRK
jgi:hypothetical protein